MSGKILELRLNPNDELRAIDFQLEKINQTIIDSDAAIAEAKQYLRNHEEKYVG